MAKMYMAKSRGRGGGRGTNIRGLVRYGLPSFQKINGRTDKDNIHIEGPAAGLPRDLIIHHPLRQSKVDKKQFLGLLPFRSIRPQDSSNAPTVKAVFGRWLN